MDIYSVLTVLLGGGIVSAAIAVLKFKPERDSIIVSSAQNATDILQKLNENLQEEVKRLRARNLELAGNEDGLRRQIDALENQVVQLQNTIHELQAELDKSEGT